MINLFSQNFISLVFLEVFLNHFVQSTKPDGQWYLYVWWFERFSQKYTSTLHQIKFYWQLLKWYIYYKNIETKSKRTCSCILYFFTEVLSQNLKYNVKQACMVNLILVGIQSSLILSIKNRGCKVFYLMTKIC